MAKKMKPIIFSTPMVQAVLDNCKSMTRRVIKPQPRYIDTSGRWVLDIPKSKIQKGCCESVCTATRDLHEYLLPTQYPHQIGDIIWVREVWNFLPTVGHICEPFARYYYKASCLDPTTIPWCSTIHMPRTAALIFLRVTGVRAERLQDIPLKDIEKEGVVSNSSPCPLDMLAPFVML